MRNCVDNLAVVEKEGECLGRISPSSSIIQVHRSAESTKSLLPVFESERGDGALFHSTWPDFSLKEPMLVVQVLKIKAIDHFRNTHMSLPNLPRFFQGCWSCRWCSLIICLFQHQKVIQVLSKTLS